MIFSEETMESLREYGAVLREIHNRLVDEGKLKKIDGKWVFSEVKKKWIFPGAKENKPPYRITL